MIDTLLLHGFTGRGAELAPLAGALDAAMGARVEAPDLPGHGPVPGPAPASFEDAVDRIARGARPIVAPGGALVVGYSLGGRLALGLALRHPSLVRALVLVGATAGIEDADARAERRGSDERWAALIERCGLEAFLERWDAQPVLAGKPTRSTTATRHDPATLAATLRALGRGSQPPLGAAARALRCPALVVAGERDATHAAEARALAGALPLARACVLAGAGHAVHTEVMPAFVAAVARFARDAAAVVAALRDARRRAADKLDAVATFRTAGDDDEALATRDRSRDAALGRMS